MSINKAISFWKGTQKPKDNDDLVDAVQTMFHFNLVELHQISFAKWCREVAEKNQSIILPMSYKKSVMFQDFDESRFYELPIKHTIN
jgi:hypothetical protein